MFDFFPDERVIRSLEANVRQPATTLPFIFRHYEQVSVLLALIAIFNSFIDAN